MRRKSLAKTFYGGIVSPELHSRPDLDKYANGLKDAVNMVVLPHGPVKRRQGFEFVNRTKTTSVRLVPFIFSADQALVIEFGNLYMRIHAAGATQLETAKAISGITLAAQGVFSWTGADPTGIANGKWVYLDGIVGTIGTSYNGSFWEISDLDTGANTMKLKDPYSGAYLSTTGLTYTSGGTFAIVYEVTTSFATADLFELTFYQSQDVIIVAHENYAPVRISRTGATTWTVASENFSASEMFSTDARLVASNNSSDTDAISAVPTTQTQVDYYRQHQAYKVTAVVDGEESLPSPVLLAQNSTTISATGYSGGNYYLTLTSPVGIGIGNWLYIHATDLTEIHQQIVYVVSISGSNYFIGSLETSKNYQTGSIAFTGSPTGAKAYLASTRSDLTVAGQINELRWYPITGADYYKVYKKSPNGQVFGYVGRVEKPYFEDKNVTPDITRTPPVDYDYFGSGNNPYSVGGFEQRTVYGGAVNNPQTAYLSRSGLMRNFTQSVPLQDDDAIVMRVGVGQQNAIRHVVSMTDMMLLTSGSVVRVYATNGDPLTNENIMPRIISNGGSSRTTPVLAKGSCIFESAVGGHLNEIGYSGEQSGYQVSDISVIAPHLFDGYTFKDMAYSRAPYSIVMATRSDGDMLCLTYLPEQTVTAWTRWDTTGSFKSVAVIPENGLDVAYVATTRTVNGTTVGFIERISDNYDPSDIDDARYLDCHSVYDGTPATTIYGLWHLEGQAVKVFADGALLDGTTTVTNGTITLSVAASKVVIGYSQVECGIDLLPYYDQSMAGLGVGIRKVPVSASMRLYRSGDVTIGSDPDTAATMSEAGLSSRTGYNSTTQLFSGVVEVPVIPEWDYDGLFAVRIEDGYPLTIQSVALEIETGE